MEKKKISNIFYGILFILIGITSLSYGIYQDYSILDLIGGILMVIGIISIFMKWNLD